MAVAFDPLMRLRARDRRRLAIGLGLGLALGLALCVAGWPGTGVSLAGFCAASGLGLGWANWPQWRKAAWWRGRGGLPKSYAPRSFLRYGNFLHLKLALTAVAAASLAYLLDDPPGGPSGGSALGYALGVFSTALVVWLLWFGVRKRRYDGGGAPLQAWLSGHVYLGLTLLVLVPLHCGFQFGWNLHSLAGALLFLTLVSGIFGLVAYTQIPARMTRNRPGQQLEGLLQQVADLDEQLRAEARELRDAEPVRRAIEETRIGGGLAALLFFSEANCATTQAQAALKRARDDDPGLLRPLELLTTKQAILRRVRRDLRYKALLDLWLVLHVPLSLACVAAVAVHVLAVFYYR